MSLQLKGALLSGPLHSCCCRITILVDSGVLSDGSWGVSSARSASPLDRALSLLRGTCRLKGSHGDGLELTTRGEIGRVLSLKSFLSLRARGRTGGRPIFFFFSLFFSLSLETRKKKEKKKTQPSARGRRRKVVGTWATPREWRKLSPCLRQGARFKELLLRSRPQTFVYSISPRKHEFFLLSFCAFRKPKKKPKVYNFERWITRLVRR